MSARTLLLFCAVVAIVDAFYLPGVAPQHYKRGDRLMIKAQSLTSRDSQLTFDYDALPYCQAEDKHEFAENLGEALAGEKSVNSPYEALVLEPSNCKVLCRTMNNAKAMEEFQDFAVLGYRVNMRADNLPMAEVQEFIYADSPEDERTTLYALGVPVGLLYEAEAGTGGADRYQLMNHLTFTIQYHEVAGETDEGVLIVGFHVRPASVAHHTDGVWNTSESCKNNCIQPELSTCNSETGKLASEPQLIRTDLKEDESMPIVWTYSVQWEASQTKWASRWDVYLQMKDDNIHWFSVINSIIMVVFLTGIIAMIMTRVLRKDFAMYAELANDEETAQELREETGWKLVYGDVFRTPAKALLLCCVLGTGAQVLFMLSATLGFALLGFLSPSNRGALLSTIILFYVLVGSFGGYVSARYAKFFKDVNKLSSTVTTACFIPGLIFSIFFIINFIVWVEGSSGAVPFGTMFAVCLLWFGISLPLVFFGSFLGYRRNAIEVPCRTNAIPRQIPPQPFHLQTLPTVLLSGVLPYGVVFVELTVILGSIWQHRFYYMFGFLGLVFIILVITVAEISIVFSYLQLCSEDYNWWWRSVLTGGSLSGYVFFYSVYYYTRHVHFNGLGSYVSCVVFGGYSAIVCILLFVMCGFVSFTATFWFIKLIYGSVKVD